MVEFDFIATCPKGFELLLQEELVSLGAGFQRESPGQVWCSGTQEVIYRACLWSRLANKVLLLLGDEPVANIDELYQAVAQLPWEEHLSPNGQLWVDFNGTSGFVRNSQFGALKVKDAIVDRLREKFNIRPSVSKESPDVIVHCRLAKGRLRIGLDLSGESLHRRGYRLQQGVAPLKENLAAALLLRANWPAIAKQGGALLDPMCGSGTLLIEGALMAADMAPGLKRRRFAFETWLNHRNDLWLELRDEALGRIDLDAIGEIRGYDFHRGVLDAAEANIGRAGLADKVRVLLKPVREFRKPTHTTLDSGLVLTNPPYGERLGELEQLTGLYAELGKALRAEFEGWHAGIFTGNPTAAKHMGLRSHKKYKLYNGSIASELLLFEVQLSQFVDAAPPKVTLTAPSDPYKVTPGAEMIINRLHKNLKTLKKASQLSDTDSYRVYDADIPEYSAAVDVYGDYVHVQEYQAPKSVPDDKAKARLFDIIAAVKQVLQPDIGKISIKQRRRNRGKNQYEKQTPSAAILPFRVTEEGARYEVNLSDYLDTGVFLDHRPVRRYIQSQAAGKRFLNLYCYTATASVRAGLGGALTTTSVDMSNTYLNWAKRNFQANNLVSDKHRFEQADVFEWLRQCRAGYDLILLDPPTFSNSKRMAKVLDIQQDHVGLIERCMDLLSPEGVLIFSNNLRSFKLDVEALSRFHSVDFHEQSLDPDFKRNPKIHRCWLFSHRPLTKDGTPK